MTASPSTDLPAPPTIAADDPRIAPYRRHLQPREFAGFHAWLTIFYAFQLTWLFEDARFAVANKARQIGWTHTTAGLLVLWAAFRRQPCTIISRGAKEAQEVLEKCRWHIAVLRKLGCERMVATIRSSDERIVFNTGGSIVALPATGGRSFSGNLFLDEFAYHPNPDKLWDAAAPSTSLGYKLRVVSTPNGAGNEFHSLWERATGLRTDVDERAPPAARLVRWVPYEVPLQVAVDQGFPVDVGACWTIYAKGDPRLFDQLFNCSFLDSVLQYLGSDKINACRVARTLLPDGPGVFYAGLDIGREVDLTTLAVVRDHQGVADLVHLETKKRTDDEGLQAMVDWAFRRYKLRRLCLDKSGLGTFPSDRMKKRHGDRVEVPHRRNRVEALDFTPKNKEMLATNLYAVVTDAKVRLPMEDRHLPTFERRDLDEKGEEVGGPIPVNEPGTAAAIVRELASIRRIITPSGNVSYDAPRTRDGHADRAWALALALHARDARHPMLEALQARIGKTA